MSYLPMEPLKYNYRIGIHSKGLVQFQGEGHRGKYLEPQLCRWGLCILLPALISFIALLPTWQCVFTYLLSVPVESKLHGRRDFALLTVYSLTLQTKYHDSRLSSISRGFRGKEHRQSVRMTSYLVPGQQRYFIFNLRKWLVLHIIVHLPSFHSTVRF